MYYSLRTKDNKSIVEARVSVDSQDDSIDVVTSVNIKHYTDFLFANPYKIGTVTNLIHWLVEMRGYMWENYQSLMGKDGDVEKANVKIKEVMDMVAFQLDLSVVED